MTIVEFSDFQCPFCAQVGAVVPDVLKAYPADVNFVYKPDSVLTTGLFFSPSGRRRYEAQS